MKISVKQLADDIEGRAIGDVDLLLSGLYAIEEETIEDGITPLFKKRFLKRAQVTPVAVLTDESTGLWALQQGVSAAVVHPVPALLLARAIDRFYPSDPQPGSIHPSAVVDPDATVHATAVLGPFVVVEAGACIGAMSRVGAHGFIGRNCFVGDRVVIGPGAVIGHEGFGFVPTKEGSQKIRQVGRVVIEDDVEIGALTCIDRGTLGATRIGQGTKIDNLVQIGHNVQVGSHVLMAGQVGLAGSSIVHDHAMLGGQVGVADHLTIGKGARIAAKSGVTGDVPPHATVAGYPAMPHKKWLKAWANCSRHGILGVGDDDGSDE